MTLRSTMPQPIALRFKVDDYYKVIELGMLTDYGEAEIIEGELIKKMAVRDRHTAVVNKLNRFFSRNLSDEILVSIQNPVRLTEYDEPEPDITLADLRKFDGNRHPRPDEVILIIEVSNSTVEYDRDKKLRFTPKPKSEKFGLLIYRMKLSRFTLNRASSFINRSKFSVAAKRFNRKFYPV
jgi:hypothetical protein